MRAVSTVGIPSFVALALSGCGSQPSANSGEALGEASFAFEENTSSGCDPAVAAGDGWLNRPVPNRADTFSASFRSAPSGGAAPGPIDAVIGLSHGPARTFSDLGAIVRFGPNGNIDARNGGDYAGGFPYTFGDGTYDFQLLVDIPQHRYSIFVRHLDSPFKPFEVLAQDFAFRTEQRSVGALDNLATFVDSAAGAVRNCAYAQDPPTGCVRSSPGVWQSRPFVTLGEHRAELDFYAWSSVPGIDAVIGAASGAPTRFSDLAAIVRFRVDGRFDARDGSSYAADAEVPYVAGSYYRIAIQLDLTRGTYSVAITPPGRSSITLARDYAFRSEQTGLAGVDHLGQFVDATPGTVHTCAVVAH